MTPRPLVAAAVAAALLAASPAASASTDISSSPAPNPSSKLIVMGKSIGGLKLGDSYATMTKVWGKPTSCNAAKSVCSYYARRNGAKALVHYTRGAVSTLSLQTAPKTHATDTLGLFHDDIGVHLGLRSAQIGQAYPTGTWHRSNLFIVPGPGNGETVITTAKGKITALMVRIAPSKLQG